MLHDEISPERAEELREKLKQLRGKLHLTQEEMARLLGVHRISVVRWEGGEQQFSTMASAFIEFISKSLKAGGKAEIDGNSQSRDGEAEARLQELGGDLLGGREEKADNRPKQGRLIKKTR